MSINLETMHMESRQADGPIKGCGERQGLTQEFMDVTTWNVAGAWLAQVLPALHARVRPLLQKGSGVVQQPRLPDVPTARRRGSSPASRSRSGKTPCSGTAPTSLEISLEAHDRNQYIAAIYIPPLEGSRHDVDDMMRRHIDYAAHLDILGGDLSWHAKEQHWGDFAVVERST